MKKERIPTEVPPPEVKPEKPSPTEMCFEYLSKIDARSAGHFSFGYFDKNGLAQSTDGYACYALMLYYKSPLAIYTVFTHCDVNDDLKRMYISYLLDEECPWGDVVRLQYKPAWNVDFILDHGFLFSDLDISSNWLMDFMIAGRICGEFSSFLPVWCLLVGAGVYPRIAMNFGVKFIQKRGTSHYYLSTNNNGNHFPFPLTVHGVDNFVRNSRDDSLLRPSYSKDQMYRPVQDLWRGHHIYMEEWNYSFLKKMYPVIFAEARDVVSPGKFRTSYSGTIFSEKTLIQLALAEQTRLDQNGTSSFIKRFRQNLPRLGAGGLPEKREGLRSA